MKKVIFRLFFLFIINTGYSMCEREDELTFSRSMIWEMTRTCAHNIWDFTHAALTQSQRTLKKTGHFLGGLILENPELVSMFLILTFIAEADGDPKCLTYAKKFFKGRAMPVPAGLKPTDRIRHPTQQGCIYTRALYKKFGDKCQEAAQWAEDTHGCYVLGWWGRLLAQIGS